MTSSFVQHHTQPLIALSNPAHLYSVSAADSLRILLSSTRDTSAQSLQSLQEALHALRQCERNGSAFLATSGDAPDDALEYTILRNVVIGAYSQTLEMHLREASELEDEAEWWSYIGRSTSKSAYYLLQTLPERILRLIQVCGEHLRAQGIPVQLSSYRPQLLRRVFADSSRGRSNPLAAAFFPHLEAYGASGRQFVGLQSRQEGFDLRAILVHLQNFLALAKLPIDLARQECQIKRKELEKLRDSRSEVLGALVQLREALTTTLKQDPGEQDFSGFITVLEQTSGLSVSTPQSPMASSDVLDRLQTLLQDALPGHQRSHQQALAKRYLIRPSFLTRSWPRLLLLPPALLYSVSTLYTSRASILHAAQDTGETLRIFFRSWLLEPLKDIIQTVRAGREQGVIIQREAIEADLASLERMIVALAKDTLKWSPEQLQKLSHQVRIGDLTPVLEVYENDIKSPLRSAVSGTLLRSVFIQVQKAKVDIDQALAGIDKLLKSQELTFAFVGVAPAFGLVYVLGGYLRGFLFSGNSNKRFGGRKQRLSAWSALRRVEHLLLTQPSLRPTHQGTLISTYFLQNGISKPTTDILPLTTGLLLLSVTRLRTYAETYLPLNSELREGFLQDVDDLENPLLGRDEKLQVISRMWRSWSVVLGWGGADLA